ncbi:class I adenylate-forming enzyme family protein [Aestuariicoccus sp. MJ-SS9]|uniref:class I adenylate-forming enzyme family protein n=1 Tax=Aestuariicoccus sp. MJ-SS9 TaxID=3079855 RepID=UPI003977B049
MIISGGENIYPTEVEALLGQHPDVKDVAVVGLPDEKWGERVAAAIVRRDGSELSAEALIEWTRTRLAGFKRPREIVFLSTEEMPRNATGKILHRVLRDILSEITGGTT